MNKSIYPLLMLFGLSFTMACQQEQKKTALTDTKTTEILHDLPPFAIDQTCENTNDVAFCYSVSCEAIPNQFVSYVRVDDNADTTQQHFIPEIKLKVKWTGGEYELSKAQLKNEFSPDFLNEAVIHGFRLERALPEVQMIEFVFGVKKPLDDYIYPMMLRVDNQGVNLIHMD